MKKTFSVIIILFIFPILFISSYSQDEIENLFETANSYAEIKNYEEQIKIYNKILEIEPNNVQALNAKGAILILLSKVDEGIVLVDKALEIDSNFVPALVNKGAWFGTNEEIDKALEYLDKALQIEPEDLSALFNKANALKIKDPNKSVDVLDKILTIDPNNKIAIYEKTNLLNTFLKSRTDGHLQIVLRNNNGELIGYMESDVIFMSNYEPIKLAILSHAENIKNVKLDEQNYLLVSSGQSVVTETVDMKSMRTGMNIIFGTIGPQDEEILYNGLDGRSHGYMIEEGDTIQSFFQLLFFKGDFPK